ncbi:MAG: hypothetical protein CHACPFDD_01478 [Phycisphaerae bacterium]|nr:hypothetical protein [Phycisphaerae bacterium]
MMAQRTRRTAAARLAARGRSLVVPWVGAIAPARLFAVGVLVLSVGCQGSGGTGTMHEAAPGIAAVSHPTLEDFPLPTGFSLVDDHSLSRTSGQMRMVQYEFTGGANPPSVIRFFKEQLNAAGWTLKKERFDRGEQVMQFQSDREDCEIRVRAHSGRTIFNVDIGPLPSGSSERVPRRS